MSPELDSLRQRTAELEKEGCWLRMWNWDRLMVTQFLKIHMIYMHVIGEYCCFASGRIKVIKPILFHKLCIQVNIPNTVMKLKCIIHCYFE